jgi:uncharacterized protein (TIGR02117 family)
LKPNSLNHSAVQFLKRPCQVVLQLAVALALCACAETRSGIAATGQTSARSGNVRQDHFFYVGCRRWHSSITVERAAIPKNAWPAGIVETTFRGCHYIEVGWGDADFYMARHPTVFTAFDAVFLPGPSVLLLVGLDPPLERALPWGNLVRVPCTAQEFNALCREIGGSFKLDEKGNAKAVGVGLYGRTSRFYEARGLYSGLNTCNHWTTRTMRAGGLKASVAPNHTWSSGAVVAQARRLVEKRTKEASSERRQCTAKAKLRDY